MDVSLKQTENFTKWLNTLGYAESTVYISTGYVNEFFTWLLSNNITELDQINKQVIKNYHVYLQTRKNKRQSGGLSNNYIASNIKALKRFNKYLQLTGQGSFEIDLQLQAERNNTLTILTKEEIQLLYKACGNDILGIRDRAMLSIYYGCGLRRTEGENLNLNDILLREKRIYVQKGKNSRQRYVPITTGVKEELENYIYVAREKLQSFKPQPKQQALFLSMQVKRLCSVVILQRVKKLAKKAGVNKNIGLHTLRHSIATHLLQSGMALEEVSQFLGHNSLESTQIYTHVSKTSFSQAKRCEND